VRLRHCRLQAMTDAPPQAHFDAELDAVSAQLLAMGGLAESQLSQALYAITRASGETASQVLQLELRLNAAEVALERELWAMVARRQPTARDLRLLIAVSKMVRDLERIGDEATRVAKVTHRLLAHGLAGTLRDPIAGIGATGALALRQLRQALDAFARHDVALALAVLRSDETLDAGFEQLMRSLVLRMGDDPRCISPGIDLVFVAKALERVGDHAKNLAEQVIYCVKGTDVRHTPRGGVEALVN
jgi:phosphate transport system protein